MNMTDSLNALFHHGVTAATLSIGPQGQKAITVEQEFATQDGASKSRHQVFGNDWPDVVTKALVNVTHCAELKTSILKLN